MDYHKITFRITDKACFVKDVMISLLGEIGFESFEDTSMGFNGYIPENQYDHVALLSLINEITSNYNCSVAYREEVVKEQNWNAVWEQNSFEPIRIGKKLAIYPTTKIITECEYGIEINPVQAFGSGYHETTRMMLSYIMDENLKDKSFLDMGCGTAVLAILAKKRGASPVVAIDIDHWSTENAIENAKLNDINDIQVVLGDASAIKPLHIRFDYIFANINRNILIRDIKFYVETLKPGGKLFLSGFYSEDLPIVEKETNRLGLKFADKKEENNWLAAKFIFTT